MTIAQQVLLVAALVLHQEPALQALQPQQQALPALHQELQAQHQQVRLMQQQQLIVPLVALPAAQAQQAAVMVQQVLPEKPQEELPEEPQEVLLLAQAQLPAQALL